MKKFFPTLLVVLWCLCVYLWDYLPIDTNRLHKAIVENKVSEVIRLLEKNSGLANNKRATSTPLSEASSECNAPIVKILLRYGADVNDSSGRHNCTSLTVASARNCIEVMKILIGNGADVDKEDDIGTTPLMAAAESGYVNAIELLLREKVKIVSQKFSVIHQHRHSSLLILGEIISACLLTYGANPNKRIGRESALGYAIRYNHPECVKLLLENGARGDLETLINDAERDMVSIFGSADNKTIEKLRTIIKLLKQYKNSKR